MQALESLAAWHDRIVPALESIADQMKRAYAAGDVPYLTVLEYARQVIDARLRDIDLQAAVRTAAADLDRCVGARVARGTRTMTRRDRCLSTLLPAAIALAVAACAAPALPKSPAPAKVANPQKEADLTTITLTPEAERRLGIETAVLGVQEIGGERRLGGELLVPPGRTVPVTAPVAGRVDGVEGVRPSAGWPCASSR